MGEFSIDLPCNPSLYLLPFYLCGFLYTFVCCSVLTEDFFVPSLEKLAIRWKLSKDVAGATLMAVGSSGPEICVNVIDTIFGEEDLGLVSVLGSSLFNICFITAMSIIYAPAPLEVSARPFIRDFVFYFLAIILLTVAINDYEVECIEAFTLLILYAMYVVFLVNNDAIWARIDRALGLRNRAAGIEDVELDGGNDAHLLHAENGGKGYDDGQEPENDEFDYTVIFQEVPLGFEIHPCPNYVNGVVGKRLGSFAQGNVLRGSMILSANDQWLYGLSTGVLTEKIIAECQAGGPIRMSFRAKKWMVDTPIGDKGKLAYHARGSISLPMNENTHELTAPPGRGHGRRESLEASDLMQVAFEREGHEDHEGEHSTYEKIMHSLECPVKTVMGSTIPVNSLYGSFFACLGWILIISWLLTQLTKLTGCTLGIDMVLMGMVFLAAGTSIPDMLCSITVAKKMEGDMCIANISGSNISNCLLGIGLPWFLETLVKGEPHRPATENITYYFMFLIGSMFLSLATFCFHKFRLSNNVAYFFLVVYVIFCSFVYYIDIVEGGGSEEGGEKHTTTTTYSPGYPNRNPYGPGVNPYGPQHGGGPYAPPGGR